MESIIYGWIIVLLSATGLAVFRRLYRRRLEVLTRPWIASEPCNMTDRSTDSPRRYFVDTDGRRVLVGLTIEETFEFEMLESLLRLHDGNVLWDESEFSGTRQQRWRELYAKHEYAWSDWLAASRTRKSEELPFFN